MKTLADTIGEYFSEDEVKQMVDTQDKLLKEANDKLYGPKFCNHCQKVQPIQTYKLDGSDFSKMDGMTMNIGFTGARICSVCYHNIETE